MSRDVFHGWPSGHSLAKDRIGVKVWGHIHYPGWERRPWQHRLVRGLQAQIDRFRVSR